MRSLSTIYKTSALVVLFSLLNTFNYYKISAESLIAASNSNEALLNPVQLPVWIINRPYRISLQIQTQGYSDIDKPVEYQINFTDYLQSFNINQAFDDKSIKVIEVNSQPVAVDTTITFQFDKDSDFDAKNKASGQLIFIMKGLTNPDQIRYYQIYFDVAGKQYQLPQFTNAVNIADNISRAGQPSFRISANNTQFYFQKQGAGFASLIDKDGVDWINYNTNSQNEQYRGIPNLGSCGHPGYPLSGDPGTLGSTSTIVSTGPLKVKIHSITTDNNWEFTWEFFPNFARMTLLKKGGNYWFLYEGVPDGSMNLNSDYSVRNTHMRLPLSESWTTGVLPSPKWAYFGDTKVQRVLFLAMHETDTHNDFYRPYLANPDPTNMTVFGFGRQDPVQPNGKLLTEIPAHFTIGLVDDTTYSVVSRNILSDISSLKISQSFDAPAPPVPPIPLLVSPNNSTSNLQSIIKFVWDKCPRADSYELQVSDNSSFSTAVYDNSNVTDTTKEVDLFNDGTKYYWRVKAINVTGQSNFSEVRYFITALNKPEKLNVQFIFPARFKISWTDNSKAVSGYYIERKAENGNYKLIDSVKSNVTAYTDTTLISGGLYSYRVRAYNSIILSDYSNEADGSFITEVTGSNNVITEYSLHQNYPNPFNPTTKIGYTIPFQSRVKLVIYDITGKEIISYKYDNQAPGRYGIIFNADALSSGIYFYSIIASALDGSKSFTEVRKMSLLK